MMFQDDKPAAGTSSEGGDGGGKIDVSASYEQLRVFIGRAERLQEEIDGLNEDKADVFKEAKAVGFDTAIMKIVLKRRRAGATESQEQDVLVQLYEDAMKRQVELPLTRH